MSEQVRVESIDALKRFRAAFCKFAEAVGVGLDEAEAEIQRTRSWVHQDQQNYWKQQVQKRSELYTRAKSELTRKKLMKTPTGGRYSCIEEEKALRVAERRLEEARQKTENVRRWRRRLDDESRSYLAIAQGLSIAIQTDVPTALAQLDNMITALEAYAASTAPAARSSDALVAASGRGPGREAGESMARAAPPPEMAAGERYQRLRSRTPDQAARDATPIAAHEPGWPPAPRTVETPDTVLAGLNLARVPAAPESKVIVADGVWQAQRIYLERVKSARPDDSGWYIGIADDTVTSDYTGVQLGDVLSYRPDLSALLELPEGCLAVLDGALLVAVLDQQGTVLRTADPTKLDRAAGRPEESE